MSEIVAHAWLSGRDTIGIVITKDEITGEYKGRIAPVTGVNEQADLQWVKERGSYLKLNSAVAIIADHGEWYAGEIPDDIWGIKQKTESA